MTISIDLIDDPSLESFGGTPFNISVMDVDRFILERSIKPVSSLLIYEPSSQNFHPDGLFSEEIFGAIGTEERLETYGYIDLNTTIIAPVIYRALLKLSKFYDDVMAGRAYAVFNPVTKNFDPVLGDPEEHVGAETGYSFFMRYFRELEFTRTNSPARETRLTLLDKYRTTCLYTKFIVEPAGLRDLSNDDNGKMIQDDINKLYTSLMSYSFAIPPGSQSPLYDSVRYTIQIKAIEIYEYLENMMTNKRGFLQGRYGHRRVAMGTRNVISAASYTNQRPDDPQTLGPNETMVGVFQAMKAMQPLIVHGFKILFSEPVFGSGQAQIVPLIHPKTYLLAYQEITEAERLRFTTSLEIESWINRFRNIDVRDKPIIVRDVNNKPFYLCLVYDTGEEIALFRSITDLKTTLGVKQIDMSHVHPITWIEAFYMITAGAAIGRHAFVTRYPVLHDTSCYPSMIHVASTSPARVVQLRNLLEPDGPTLTYPEYPILGESYLDTVVPSAPRLSGLGGDFDGDTVSFNIIMSEEANREVANYLASPKSVLDISRRMIGGSASDLVNLVYYNLSAA